MPCEHSAVKGKPASGHRLASPVPTTATSSVSLPALSSSPRSSFQVEFHEDFESRIDRVLAKGNFTENDAASVTYSVLDAVDYLHHRGIVQQDLECAFLSPSLHPPENIPHCSNDPIAISSSSTLACKPHPFSTLDSPLLMFLQSKTHSFLQQATSTRIHRLIALYLHSYHHLRSPLLCSHPHFVPMTSPHLSSKNVDPKTEFHSPYWSPISNQAKSFIRRLAALDPLHHPTALCDSWLTSHHRHRHRHPCRSLSHT